MLDIDISSLIFSQYAHFHGTNDGVIPYEGGAPAMLQGAEVIPAQE